MNESVKGGRDVCRPYAYNSAAGLYVDNEWGAYRARAYAHPVVVGSFQTSSTIRNVRMPGHHRLRKIVPDQDSAERGRKRSCGIASPAELSHPRARTVGSVGELEVW